jgi:uncharacterized membrane protein YeaQ/YmgE (transglycosylase-associated protein family)
LAHGFSIKSLLLAVIGAIILLWIYHMARRKTPAT